MVKNLWPSIREGLEKSPLALFSLQQDLIQTKEHDYWAFINYHQGVSPISGKVLVKNLWPSIREGLEKSPLALFSLQQDLIQTKEHDYWAFINYHQGVSPISGKVLVRNLYPPVESSVLIGFITEAFHVF